jgi:hypothetical protein
MVGGGGAAELNSLLNEHIITPIMARKTLIGEDFYTSLMLVPTTKEYPGSICFSALRPRILPLLGFLKW